MDKMRILGGRPLQGSVTLSGSKNAALPILISSLLTDEPCNFSRVPHLQDIVSTVALLQHMGVICESALEKNQLMLHAKELKHLEAPYDLVRKMRASVLVLGPMLARYGQAKVSLPGGCAIGARPINYHLVGLEKLGAEIELKEGYIYAKAKKLKGARVTFDFPSVGATENVMMAAALAEGKSILENVAREPEIVDLARALRAMGAEIRGEGTETIEIQGRSKLHGMNYEVMGDRIEAGTFLAAGFATQGRVKTVGIEPESLRSVLNKFEEAGAKITTGVDWIELDAQGKRARATDIETQPFPGFPTDMQAQFMTVMCVADGACVITENIFENRFMHVSELARLGADIRIKGNVAFVRGKAHLIGAPIMATDLRASASLIIGGLCAEGETVVNRIYHLDRGYERMEKKLQSLGAQVERIK